MKRTTSLFFLLALLFVGNLQAVTTLAFFNAGGGIVESYNVPSLAPSITRDTTLKKVEIAFVGSSLATVAKMTFKGPTALTAGDTYSLVNAYTIGGPTPAMAITTFGNNQTVVAGDWFTVLEAVPNTEFLGTFTSIAISGVINAKPFAFRYESNVPVTTPIPEPSAVAIIAFTGIGLTFRRRR